MTNEPMPLTPAKSAQLDQLEASIRDARKTMGEEAFQKLMAEIVEGNADADTTND